MNGLNKFSTKNIHDIAKELTILNKEKRKTQSSNMLAFKGLGKTAVIKTDKVE